MDAKAPTGKEHEWVNPLAQQGFKVAKTKYFTIKSDDRSVYGKQVGNIMAKRRTMNVYLHVG